MQAQTVYNTIGHTILQLDTIDSTNSYAIEAIQTKKAVHGQVIFAHHQTQGRGQRGRVWQTENGGSNIIISVIVNTNAISITRSFMLSAGIAVACAKFYNQYTASDTTIKWPNDIYWNDRKAGGILIENIIRGNQWQWAVVGIGLNINQTHFEGLKNAVSLKQITGKQFDVLLLVDALCKQIDEAFKNVLHVKNDGLLIAEYNHFLYSREKAVKLKKENIIFNCVVKGVNANGTLEVAHPVYKCFEFGEIEWILH